MKKIDLNKKGFTLVELLAVIVILALLMVVATRTIGSSLTNSRTEAMKTEASKIVSKTYEDLQTAELMSTETNYTYSGVAGTTGYKDGNYTIKITVDKYKMSSVCITDGTKYGKGTITGSTIKWDGEGNYIYTDTSC